jgi:REP-associated tyrosine transposase
VIVNGLKKGRKSLARHLKRKGGKPPMRPEGISSGKHRRKGNDVGRKSRIVLPGYPQLVTRRSGEGARIFFDDNQRRGYLRTLREQAALYEVAILAYCLMDDHVHLVVAPPDRPALRGFMEGIGGSPWEDGFSSCILDEEFMWAAIRYVERNPTRAGLALAPAAYRWSSAAARCGLRRDALLGEHPLLAAAPRDWARFLAEEYESDIAEIRSAMANNAPWGTESFLLFLDSLRPRKLGMAVGG